MLIRKHFDGVLVVEMSNTAGEVAELFEITSPSLAQANRNRQRGNGTGLQFSLVHVKTGL